MTCTHIGRLDQSVQHIRRRFAVHPHLFKPILTDIDPAIFALGRRVNLQFRQTRLAWRESRTRDDLATMNRVGTVEGEGGYRGEEGDTACLFGRHCTHLNTVDYSDRTGGRDKRFMLR